MIVIRLIQLLFAISTVYLFWSQLALPILNKSTVFPWLRSKNRKLQGELKEANRLAQESNLNADISDKKIRVAKQDAARDIETTRAYDQLIEDAESISTKENNK